MNIESGINNNCIARAISTMRIVLGIDGILPINFDDGKRVIDIVRKVGLCFPDNEIYIWCRDDLFLDSDINVHYCGTSFSQSFDDTKYVIAFAYFDPETDNGHMVIGFPVGFKNVLGLCMAVKENNVKKKKDV